MPKGVRFDEIDLETVAALLGVSTRQVSNYMNHKGLPSKGSGRQRTFVWGDVLEWFIQYRWSLETGDGNDGSDDAGYDDASSESGGKNDIRAANLRKTRAEADLKQLQLAKLRGQWISIPDAKVKLDRMMGNLRAKLLSLAPKLSSRIEGESTRTDREAVIKEELLNLCSEISTGAVVDIPEDVNFSEDAEEIDTDVVDDISAAADPDSLGYLFTLANRPEALAQANELVRVAREMRDRLKEYFRARVQ